ncbi:chorismate mutase [Actinosynnema sp. NPDC050801]|uniref:chorismate mutase n=1 Tax=unclassified Actinosynnema TaxID=2637065 RepID=UPI00340BB233
MTTTVRAIRGAIQVDADTPVDIAEATREMMAEIISGNDLEPGDFVSVLFTVTGDLCSAFPAAAARDGALWDVPMMCATEISVPGGLPRVIRAMAHVHTTRSRSEIRHVYLRGAVVLRPDLVTR